MPFDTIARNGVPLQTVAEWYRIRNGQFNPLNLDETVLLDTLELVPPKEFEGGHWLGRYLVPLELIVFNPEDQPRDKSNDVNHVTDLTNRYELMGYAKDAQPMMGTMASGSDHVVVGFAGFHRKS